jgi:hypothetical protein
MLSFDVVNAIFVNAIFQCCKLYMILYMLQYLSCSTVRTLALGMHVRALGGPKLNSYYPKMERKYHRRWKESFIL